MSAHRFHNPVSVEVGPGALDGLPRRLAGRRVVIVTFPEARGLGLVSRLEALLGDAVAGVEDRVTPNPDVRELAPLYARFWETHASCDAILAVGGGSAIDTGKALMVGTASGTFGELMGLLSRGAAFVPHRVKPLIAVPTTAGTGSEVTPWATIWEQATGRKHSLHLAQTWPEAAIVDPQLMLSLPPSVTLQSALDALSHALESIWNVNANPVSDALAVSAARDVMAWLPALLREPSSIGLRTRLAVAALKAGLAFSNTKTALAHSISYEMTLRFGLPHGIACSFTLPMVLGRAIGRDAGRDAVLAEVFPGRLEDAPALLARFLEALGVKTDFAAYGVDGAESQRMVRDAMDGVRGRNFIGAAGA